jgi:hypothetical protein
MLGLIGGILQNWVGGNTPSQIAGRQAYQQSTIFGEQQGFEQMMQKLWQDPSSVTQTPGYQFNLNQGLQALSRQYGRLGQGGSGTADLGLMNYAQGYASNTWMQQLGMLAGLSGIAGGAGSTASLGRNALQGAQQQQGMWSQAGSGVSSIIGTVMGFL